MDIPKLDDDTAIPDEEFLYRGVHHTQVKEDGTISSGAFVSGTNPHPSIDRSSLTTPEESLARKPSSVALARLTAGAVRERTVGVKGDPKPENPAHALIIRDPRCVHSAWKRVAKHLADACSWAIAPGTRSDFIVYGGRTVKQAGRR